MPQPGAQAEEPLREESGQGRMKAADSEWGPVLTVGPSPSLTGAPANYTRRLTFHTQPDPQNHKMGQV